MKLKKALIAILTVSVFSGFSLGIVQAWGGWGPIKPGDHVFDAKRFADSVRETAQMLQTLQNKIEILKNRILVNTNADPYFDKVNAEINKYKLPDGNTLTNPDNKFKDSIFWKSWDYEKAVKEGSVYTEKLAENISNNNKETTDVLQQTIQNQSQKYDLETQIQDIQTPGILSEKQKANAAAILEVLSSVDNSKMSGAEMINNISMQETKAAANRLENEKIKTGYFHGYDPYNPTEFDEENRPAQKEPMGFIKFGK